MKKCDVCGASYSDSQGICPVCGYEPTDLFVGGADEWQDEAAAYRCRLLQTLAVELTGYAHKAAGETLAPEARRVPLLAQGELKNDETVHWAAQRFCAVPDADPLTVSLTVARGTQRIEKQVSVTPPQEHALLQIGLSLVPDTLTARLHLKNGSSDAVSAPFGLLAE